MNIEISMFWKCDELMYYDTVGIVNIVILIGCGIACTTDTEILYLLEILMTFKFVCHALCIVHVVSALCM